MPKAKRDGRNREQKKTAGRKAPKERVKETSARLEIGPMDTMAGQSELVSLTTIGTMDAVTDSLMVSLPAPTQIDDPRKRLHELVESLPFEKVEKLVEELENEGHSL